MIVIVGVRQKFQSSEKIYYDSIEKANGYSGVGDSWVSGGRVLLDSGERSSGFDTCLSQVVS